jgi:hypothetical protein
MTHDQWHYLKVWANENVHYSFAINQGVTTVVIKIRHAPTSVKCIRCKVIEYHIGKPDSINEYGLFNSSRVPSQIHKNLRLFWNERYKKIT